MELCENAAELSEGEKAKNLRFMAHILILIVNERFNDCISEIQQIDSLEYEIMHQLFLSKLTYLDLIDKLNKLNKKVCDLIFVFMRVV